MISMIANEAWQLKLCKNITAENWKLLLRLFLAQQLELNAIESALKNSGILSDEQIREIRKQTSDTAAAWVSDNTSEALALLRVHSSPGATMLVPPLQENPRRKFNVCGT